MLATGLTYLLLGAVAGLLAGLLGVGGGLVIVPALAFWFAYQGFSMDLIMQLAIGSSLATIVFTSLASVRAHHRRNSVDWPILRTLVPGIVIGAMGGAFLARVLPSETLRLAFGVFECLVGLQFLVVMQVQEHQYRLSRAQGWLVGTGIGGLSALLGIGGGTLTVPYLRWHGVDIRRAVGTSAAAGLPIALAGSVGFAWVGQGMTGLPEPATGFLYWPAIVGIGLSSIFLAPVGARMAHWLPRARLQQLFGAVLLLVGVRMLWG